MSEHEATSSTSGLPPLTRVPTLALTSPRILRAFIPPRQDSRGASHRLWENTNRVTEVLKGAALSSLGQIPRQELERQIERLPLSSDTTARSTGARAAEVVLGALHRLSCRYLEWRGDRVFLVDGRRLEFQALLGVVLPEQIGAASSVLLGLGHHPNEGHASDRDLRPLPSLAQMRRGRARARNQPLIPIPAGTYLRTLRQKGLPELHRHHNGATFPLLLWPEVLDSAGEIAGFVRQNGMDVGAKSRIQALTGSDDEPIADQVYRVLVTTRRLRGQLHRYVSLSDEERESLSSEDREDGLEKQFNRTLRALRDRHAGFALAIEGPGPRTRTLTEYIDQAAGTLEDVESEAARERDLLVNLVYRLAADWTQRGATSDKQQRPSDAFARAACSYLILQNRLLNAMVQPADDAEGLARFVYQFFDHPFREVTEKRAELRFEQASTSGAVEWLEIRQSTSGDPLQKLRDPWHATERLRGTYGKVQDRRVRGLRDSWSEQRERVQACLKPDRSSNSPAVGTIFHFIRKPASLGGAGVWAQTVGASARIADRYNGIRSDLVEEAYSLRTAARHPILSDLFVGLDVAALETNAPIGVFAPAIRWLRSLTTGSQSGAWERTDQFQNEHVSPLGLTCHAGEDFRHLLGGLRSVDESIDYLQMRQGDRIGHGLALGVDPEVWARRTGGSVTMRVDRRFFDLIWFYDKLRSCGDGIVIEQVRSEIQRLARKLYPHRRSEHTSRVPFAHAAALPSCEVLDASRRFQKFDPRLTQQRFALHPYARFGVREIDEAKRRHGERAFDLWMYHMRDRLFATRAGQVERFKVRPEWYEAIRSVQQAVLNKLTHREVAIEINPTSNRVIGGFDSLSEHPVFDWDPPSRDADHPRPYIVVGSDDPGVFGSELLHEYAFLHAAARERGYDRAVVEDWLEELRTNGLRFLFMQDGSRLHANGSGRL